VKLINTDGMAFIGPGSEWFWTALSGIVLAVTFIAIYRQLRLAQSAGRIEQLGAFDLEWRSERLTRFKLNALIALRDKVNPSSVPEGAAVNIANFWEKVATLTRGGHIDAKLAWDAYGNDSQLWWITLGPWIRTKRTDVQDPRIFEHFEWLAGRMAQLDRQSGGSALSEAWVAGSVTKRIVGLEEAIRVEQVLRTVIIATPEAVPAPPVAALPTAPPVAEG
jgi:hypothetical protein